MRLSINQIRALPLIVLGIGVFILAATVDVPADRTGPAIVVDATAPAAATAEHDQPAREMTLAGH